MYVDIFDAQDGAIDVHENSLSVPLTFYGADGSKVTLFFDTLDQVFDFGCDIVNASADALRAAGKMPD